MQERNTGTTFQHKLGNERRIGNFELIRELFEVDNIISKRSLQTLQTLLIQIRYSVPQIQGSFVEISDCVILYSRLKIFEKISIPHLRTRAVRVQERNTGTTFQHKLGNERRIGNFELIRELFEVDNIISKRSLQNNRQNSFKFDILCLKSKD